jgi:hypothetical protein
MAQLRAFPGMPATAAKLMRLLEDSDSSASQIEEILRYDPGLTANILKLMVGFGKIRDGFAVEPDAEVTDRLGLRTAHLEALAEQTKEGVDKLTDTLMS